MILLSIVIATLLLSVLAAAIILIFSSVTHTNHTRLLYMVALSAGTLMASAFLHLLPEAAEFIESSTLFPLLLASFIGFYVIETFVQWRHCHDEDCEVHSFGYMNLIGDAVHNFIDGLLIAAAFQADITLGITTTLAITLHEIPQEIGDFGVLLHAGWSKQKALLANFVVAITSVAGGIIGFILTSYISAITPYMLVVAAGGFLYIAASALLPELRKQKDRKTVGISFSLFLIGVAIMIGVQVASPHTHAHVEEDAHEHIEIEDHDEHMEDENHHDPIEMELEHDHE